MKTLPVFLAALCLIGAASQSRAADTTAPGPTIGAVQAADFIGKQATVTGLVAQVTVRPNLTYLNFEKAYPNSPFTAIIRSSHTNEFDNVRALKGKNVSISGKVVDYNGKPEIELTGKSQLKVLDDTK